MTKHAHRAQRILLVFAPHLDEENRLQIDIQKYQHIIHRTSALETNMPDYFVLVVAPHISTYVQRTPEIQAYVERYTEECRKQLTRIGSALNIPPERQSLAEGNCNLEAWRVAKRLSVDKVYGYSKGFALLLTGWETLQSRFQRAIKKITIMLPGFLYRKQHPVR